jgi:hypothetical protein
MGGALATLVSIHLSGTVRKTYHRKTRDVCGPGRVPHICAPFAQRWGSTDSFPYDLDPKLNGYVSGVRSPTLSQKPRKDGASSGSEEMWEDETQFDAGDAVSMTAGGVAVSVAMWVDSGR